VVVERGVGWYAVGNLALVVHGQLTSATTCVLVRMDVCLKMAL